MENFKAPAVPLFVNDPYFSIWSFTDVLYEDSPRHWTGARNSMVGMVKYDNKVYRFLGKVSDCSGFYYCEPDIIPQKSVEIKPTQTKYIFENNEIALEINFISPLIADDLLLLSRPVSYITYKITPKKGTSEGSVYFDVACEACVDDLSQYVKLEKSEIGIYCGTTEQNVLGKSGDDLRIDWGYLHLLEKDGYFGKALQCRDAFVRSRDVELLSEGKEYRINEDNPVMAVVKQGNEGVIAVAYDDIKSIEYFKKQCDAYYKINGDTFFDVCKKALSDFDEIKAKCESFDKELITRAEKINKEYAKIISLAYRQTIAAHKLCFADDEMLFISKECYSNGCAATLDVTYPSMPLILVLNPELMKGMLQPIFDYAKKDEWCFDFAPHDVGRYPKANGQFYGLNEETGELSLSMQMPVEECGNALICTYAVCYAQNDFSYAESNRELLEKWGRYLAEYGFDPGEQLCTDDFGGHLNHNCNLSVKAIVGMYACGELFKNDEMKQKARAYAKLWCEKAKDGDKYRMAFDAEDTWSIKYNMVWDKIFGFGLFPKEVYDLETKFYESRMTKYGIPLDYRGDIGKPDWIMWAARMSDDKDFREKVIHSVFCMINETKQKVPLTDYYNVKNAEQVVWASYRSPAGFSNRSVVGGLGILLV